MEIDRFDLEQGIMKCWGIIEDIKLISTTLDRREMSEDELGNYLLGLETIYNARFEETFNIFERLVNERKIT